MKIERAGQQRVRLEVYSELNVFAACKVTTMKLLLPLALTQTLHGLQLD